MEFLSERFLVAKGHPLHPVKNTWRPFELGNTRCIGEELAMVEMKLVLALTMREVDFHFDWKGLSCWQRHRLRQRQATCTHQTWMISYLLLLQYNIVKISANEAK
ncbi:hypothetical protein F5Y06DRAFT_144079 [Hypoxylon sp. FL0890]|nr:hypothetical protein F5Y06DRAFT_144079 [Hypoxylon sp. FL0890]